MVSDSLLAKSIIMFGPANLSMLAFGPLLDLHVLACFASGVPIALLHMHSAYRTCTVPLAHA